MACLSAPEFTGELIEAIDRDAIAGWRARYRRATAFLLDDVHLIAAKDRTQDELFVLFNRADRCRPAARVHLGGAAGRADRASSRGCAPGSRAGWWSSCRRPMPPCASACCARDLEAKLGAADPELAAYLASRPADSIRGAQALLQRVLEAADGARASRRARRSRARCSRAPAPRAGRRPSAPPAARAASSPPAPARPGAGRRWCGSGPRSASA